MPTGIIEKRTAMEVRLTTIALVLAATPLLFGPAIAESASTGIAATVNGEVITEADLDRQLQAWPASDPGYAPPQTKLRELRLEKLNALIDRDLIIQAFYREGNKVPDCLVDGKLEGIIKEEFGGDRASFNQILAERGVTLRKYRQEIADNCIIGEMRNCFGQAWFASLRKNADIKIY